MTFLKRIASGAALGAALLLGFGPISSPAQAGYVVTLQEVGGDVVATGSGPLDLTGLSPAGTGSSFAGILPSSGFILTGPATPALDSFDIYTGFIGPTSFGGGGSTLATSGSGDVVGILSNINNNQLFVPSGYTTGTSLSDTSTYAGQTFGSLGVTPGTYVWTWGTGPDADSFTLIISTAAVPEPASLALLGTALLGFAAIRRRKWV